MSDDWLPKTVSAIRAVEPFLGAVESVTNTLLGLYVNFTALNALFIRLPPDTDTVQATVKLRTALNMTRGSNVVERCCGTCREGWVEKCGSTRSFDRLPCNHYTDSLNRPDGPPWPDCRFWKERTCSTQPM